MEEFAKWDSFYVIVGSAAGALIGLQFVVMTLIADLPAARPEAGAAFATPTIIHFSAVLFLAAILRVPWESVTVALDICGVMGVAGITYTAIVANRMRKQASYRPVFEDWLFHVLLPLGAYGLLALSPLRASSHTREGLFAVGAAALLLLFVGIHNCWDAISYHVFFSRPKGSQTKEQS